MSRDRAVSSVLGVVMILAITLAALTSMMVIGGVALQESSDEAELSRMSTSMAQMSSKASLTALGDAGMQRFDLGDTGSGGLGVHPRNGNITVFYNTTDGDEGVLVEDRHLGALVYSNGESEVAYQGGGVWKRTGDDGGEMISPPEYHYRDETLTYPIIRIQGDEASQAGASGSVLHDGTRTIFPNATENRTYTNPVDHMNVFVQIESDYHRGWYEFFESRSEGEVDHDPENQTVTKELTAPFDESIQDSVATLGDITGTDHIEGSYSEGQNRVSASSTIENKIEEHQDEDWIGGSDPGESVYYADSDVELDRTTFNTSGENITVVVNGTLTFANDVDIEGGGSVKIFTRDGFKLDGNGNMQINADGEMDQLIVYVHSDAKEIDEGNQNFNGEMTAVIYAPGSHIEWRGSADFTGAMVTYSADFGGSIEISSPDTHQVIDLELDEEGDFLRYLHITDNPIEIVLD